MYSFFGLILILLTAAVWLGVYLSYQHRKLSRQVWSLRNRVVEIESELVNNHFGTDAEEFVMHLSDLASDEAHMRQMHRIIMSSKQISEGQVINVDKILRKAFDKNSGLVSEALVNTAYASYLLGENPILHSEVKEREIQKQSFIVYKELTGAKFLTTMSGRDKDDCDGSESQRLSLAH